MFDNQFSPNQQLALDARVSQVMKRVYFKMFLALLVTAFVAMFTASDHTLLRMVAGSRTNYMIIALVEVGLVVWISAGLNRMSSTTATILFFLFAVVNGLSLSLLFGIYTGASLAKTFFITAGTFGAMSVYGYFTNRDLTKIGSFLIMALFGLIIASLANIFIKSTTMDWALSFVGVLLFLGLTAWDTQKIKQMAVVAPTEAIGKLATIGALSLYLDFINLFIYLLRFFGQQRN